MVTMTPDRWKRIRWAALKSGVGFLVFVVALYLSFPYERAKEVAIKAAASKDLDVEIGSAGPSFGFGMAFHDIRVRTRPTTGKPTRFTIDKARVTFSPWALLTGSRNSYTIAADAFGGQVDLDQAGAPGKRTPFRTVLQVHGVNMGELPGIRESINLPLGGTLKMQMDVRSETGKYADANGSISFTCADCVLGDGKTPLKVAGNPFLSGGLTLPRTRLGDLGGRIAITKGVAKLQGVEAKSADLEVSLEGEVTLHDPLPQSTVNAYLRFKFSDAFLQKAAAVQTMLQLAGAQGKRPDGAYGMKLGGRLGQMTSVLSPTSPFMGGSPPSPRQGSHAQLTPSSPPRPLQLPGPTPPPPPPPTVAEAPPPPPPPPPVAEPPPPPPPPPPAAATGAGWKGAPPTGQATGEAGQPPAPAPAAATEGEAPAAPPAGSEGAAPAAPPAEPPQ
jgi:type II secretion system protein N